MSTNLRHFLDFKSLSSADLRSMVDYAKARKKARRLALKGTADADAPLAGRTLAMIFEKTSTRTRMSFDMGMRQMGGDTIVMSAGDMQLGKGETVEDTAKVISRYVDMVMIRANSHEAVKAFAGASDIPVINGLTDYNHPCQLMADIMVFEEHRGPIEGRHIAWVGDGNNVATSWIEAAARFSFKLTLGCPKQYAPNQDIIDWAVSEGADVSWTTDPITAVKNADAVNADTFVSMGDLDADERLKILAPYQVNSDLMSHAARDALFMHCLPAYRGKEVSKGVIDGEASVVFDEAENRLHAQKAVLAWVAGLL